MRGITAQGLRARVVEEMAENWSRYAPFIEDRLHANYLAKMALSGEYAGEPELIALSKRLHTLGVLPYYLHLTDAVNGTAHFDVDELRGRVLVDALARALPGYLVPRLVREVPGEEAKVVLAAGVDAA